MLANKIKHSELTTLRETYTNIGYDVAVVETAAAGSVGAASIAVDRGGGHGMPMETMKTFMNAFNNRIQNRFRSKKKNKDFFFKINESFDLNSVFSRLAGMERAGKPKKTEGVTFGIEDDNGNIMKVTVRAEQAKAFEVEVAVYLADIKKSVSNVPAARDHKNLSMAELLFNIHNKFDIIDVEFPEIPNDVIYDAEKATPSKNNNATRTDDVNTPLDLLDYEETDSRNDGAEDDGAEDDGADLEEPEDPSVEDFPDETADKPETAESMLGKVIDMLKAQAEADIEKAKAESEKAKSEQAKYAAQAEQIAMKNEEERLRYEMEMAQEKKKEKEAKEMSKIIKHRLEKTMSVAEADEGANPQMVARQGAQIAARYAIDPTDTPEEKRYKMSQRAEAKREWDSRYKQALIKAAHDKKMEQEEKKQAAERERNKETDAKAANNKVSPPTNQTPQDFHTEVR